MAKARTKNDKRICVSNTELADSITFSGPFAYINLYAVFKDHEIGCYAPLGASGYEYTRLAQGSIQAVTKLRCGSQTSQAYYLLKKLVLRLYPSRPPPINGIT